MKVKLSLIIESNEVCHCFNVAKKVKLLAIMEHCNWRKTKSSNDLLIFKDKMPNGSMGNSSGCLALVRLAIKFESGVA